MNLREWQRKHLQELRRRVFPISSHIEEVSLIAYTFPKAGEYEAFDYLECAILQTWAALGKLRTIIVSNCHFEKLDVFANRENTINVQIERSLIPGKIETMSADCCARLYSRFSTPYCLIVQDDGFVFRDNLEEFLGKYDFVGAPYVRISWWRNIICWLLGYWMSNGGLSIRSKRICEAASRYWSHYKRFHPSELTVDDLYYTRTLPLRHLGYRFKYKIAPNKVAIRFSYDSIVRQPIDKLPMGFHRDITFNELAKYGYVEDYSLYMNP